MRTQPGDVFGGQRGLAECPRDLGVEDAAKGLFVCAFDELHTEIHASRIASFDAVHDRVHDRIHPTDTAFDVLIRLDLADLCVTVPLTVLEVALMNSLNTPLTSAVIVASLHMASRCVWRSLMNRAA